MTALDIFTYSGQQVRTVLIDGEPWFVAGDVTAILGFQNGRAAIARHTEPAQRGVSRFATSSGDQDSTILSDSGVYRLIMRSNTDGAIDFQRWLTEVVLPAIRKTGSYSTAPALTEDQIVQQALTILVAKTAALESKVAELEPAATAWDELASASGDYEVADAAKILARAGIETGRQRLFTQMRDLGWILRGGHGSWKAYQSTVDSGYLTEKPVKHFHPKTGEVVLDPPQVRVTVKGLERLRVRLGALILTP
ncbi:phage antirepressor KilAC domain-containing protein [Cryobacterium sp. Y62]|uniref:phage antirepressor KilAC domain-containing protein n=1 Tax=Cryobacterium sp. Y62 TaxID=2048284 RepID=UPI000CE48F06|nr:phage antirepressor KilAC domain-containing protein [Cryobacterium sp. Y62]